MSGIKDQSKLTKGKGFKLVKTIASPFTHAVNFTKSALSGTLGDRKNKKRGGKV